MPFKFHELDLPGLILVEPSIFADDRGAFAETYRFSDFEAHGIPTAFVQDNWSLSKRGVLRGMHYQNYPKAQGKLVSVSRGEIYDVVIDLRPESLSYMKWRSICLSAQNRQQLYVPRGFAHGFCVLSDEAEVTYKVTAEYEPSLEKGVAWNDPEIGVKWPTDEPILSSRDRKLPCWQEARLSFSHRGDN